MQLTSGEVQGRRRAEEFREEHRLGVQPIGDVVSLIKQVTDIDVAIVAVEADQHGLAVRDPDRGATFIGVASTPHPMRQRSTLAHELGHVVFEDWGRLSVAHDERPLEEVRADAFARHLLVPQAGLRDFLGYAEAAAEPSLSEVVQWFSVSPQIAAIAMKEAGYIDEATKQRWFASSTSSLATRFGWSALYQAMQDDSQKLRAPQRLLARAIAGYQEGVISLQVIATLRGIDVSDVEQELDDAGIRPLEHDAPILPAAELPDVAVDLEDLDMIADEEAGQSDESGRR